MWKQRIILSLWWLLGIAICGLLTAGMHYKIHLPCSNIIVNIEQVSGHVFINEKEITQLLKQNGAVVGKSISDIPLQPLENLLKQQPWIYNAELFFDNNQALNASILEREPLARMFPVHGASFYIDSSGMQLPLSNDYSARVPMFTGFASGNKNLSKQDSLLMNDIKKIATIIKQDSFWMAQVSQVNITPYSTFEITPVLGNQLIKLGNGDSLQSKFDRLTAFYKQVWAKSGFEKYETVSVEFNGQIVAVKRGVPKPDIDIEPAQRLIAAMRNGTDIANDTATILPANVVHLPDHIADSIAQTPVKMTILNKSVQSNTFSKHAKPPLSIKNKNGTVKKVIIKKKKKITKYQIVKKKFICNKMYTQQNTSLYYLCLCIGKFCGMGISNALNPTSLTPLLPQIELSTTMPD